MRVEAEEALRSALGRMDGAEEALRRVLRLRGRSRSSKDSAAEEKVREALWHLAVAKVRARELLARLQGEGRRGP